MQKRALITGITGQDGSYLTELLLEKGYEVHGLVRRSGRDPFTRLTDTKADVRIHYGDLRDQKLLDRLISEVQPDEIYNLAAQSDVAISFNCPEETFDINHEGVGRLVYAIERCIPHARIYQASTSEMYGTTPPPQNELSPFNPVSPYGESKLKAYKDYVVGSRESRNLFVTSGILFNHESPRRGEQFVTRKITVTLAKIIEGQQEMLSLGNLNAKRDWGYAKDYVRAMWLMMQQDVPDDFVVATGKQHTVREFVESAGGALGMTFSWEGEGVDEVGRDQNGVVRVVVNPKFYRPSEAISTCGNAAKAKSVLGWEPSVSFEELVELMATADLEAIQKGLVVS